MVLCVFVPKLKHGCNVVTKLEPCNAHSRLRIVLDKTIVLWSWNWCDFSICCFWSSGTKWRRFWSVCFGACGFFLGPFWWKHIQVSLPSPYMWRIHSCEQYWLNRFIQMEQFRDLNFPALNSELLGEWFSFVLRGQKSFSGKLWLARGRKQETYSGTRNVLRDHNRSQGQKTYSTHPSFWVPKQNWNG